MNKQSTDVKRIQAIYFLYLFIPVLSLFLLSLVSSKNLFLSLPTWSDELDYFRETFSFSENGFDFGGSLFVGEDAKVGPLGGHSFSPIVVYGLVALIFPFSEHTILYVNLALLSLAMLAFALIVRPRGFNLFFSCFLFLLFPPLLNYLYTSMLEVPLYAGLIVYFSLFYAYGKEKKKSVFIWMLITGIFVTLIRMPYVVVLFPAIMALGDYRFNKKTWLKLLVYVVSFLTVYKFYNLFCANYPDWVTAKITAADGIAGKLKVIYSNTKENIYRFFSFSIESPMQIVLRYVYGILVAITGVLSFVKQENKRLKLCFNGFWFSLFVMAGGLLCIMVCLYDIKDYRDYRTFAPIAFVLMLTVVLFTKKPLVRAVPVVTFLLLIIFSDVNVLLADREIGVVSERITGFEELENDSGLKLGATMDVNWGDVSLLKSIPSKIGYQVFYNGINEDNIDMVDYILTGGKLSDTSVVLLSEIEGYGYLYRVVK